MSTAASVGLLVGQSKVKKMSLHEFNFHTQISTHDTFDLWESDKPTKMEKARILAY